MSDRISNTDKISSDTESPKANINIQRQSRGKTCQVCGDKALGYNFNAVTCESCKAFFRRNALTKKEFTCPFNQNCDITVITRRFCQKCRLTKCFDIGMKKEYIMSEEDKIEKRKKIEANRAKRRVSSVASGSNSDELDGASTSTKRIKREIDHQTTDDETWSNINENTSFDVTTSNSGEYPLQSPVDYNSCSPSTPAVYVSQYNSTSNLTQEIPGIQLQLEENALATTSTTIASNLTPSELVDRIIAVPENSSQVINQLLPAQEDALKFMTVVISSPTDALRLINHFIACPGDALTIISKIMNSALDALSVFIQFMSSPTDALQIINKIMHSPNEVLQFIQQLVNQPQDALDIMTKFMNEPAQALKMINRMMNEDTNSNELNGDHSEQERLRKSVEGNLIKSIITTNTMEGATSSLDGTPQTFNPFNSYAHLSYAPSQCAEQLSITTSGIPQINTAAYHSQEPPKTNTIDNDNRTNNTASDITRDILEQVENKTIQPNSIESILCEAIKLEYDCFTLVSQINTTSRELNDSERAKLNELIVANKALYDPVDEDWANLISDSSRLKVSSKWKLSRCLCYTVMVISCHGSVFIRAYHSF